MQLDVLVERFRDPRRQIDLGDGRRRFRRELEPPLDFADLVGVLVDRPPIAGAELPVQAGELAADRIENAAVLAQARRADLRRRAAAEQPFEHRLRVQLHRQRAGAHERLAGGVGKSIHEIEFVYEQL